MATRERIKTEEELKFEVDGFRLLLMDEIRHKRGKVYRVIVPQEFIAYAGSMDAAIFLAQLLHWSPRAKRKDGLIFKTFDDWKAETGLSEHKVKQAVKLLVSLGVMDMPKKIMTASKDGNASPTYHYRLRLQELWDSFQRHLYEPEIFELERIAAIEKARTLKISSSITKDTSKKAVKEKYRKTATQQNPNELVSPDDAAHLLDEAVEKRQSQNFCGETFESEWERERHQRRKAQVKLRERIDKLPDRWRLVFNDVPFAKWNLCWEDELSAVEYELAEERRLNFAARV